MRREKPKIKNFFLSNKDASSIDKILHNMFFSGMAETVQEAKKKVISQVMEKVDNWQPTPQLMELILLMCEEEDKCNVLNLMS